MTDLELMIGLLADDLGATDSGIHDEDAKANLFKNFSTEQKIPKIITEYATWLLSEKGKALGYTLSDVKDFLDWLGDNGYDL